MNEKLSYSNLSIVIPARNEAASLGPLLQTLKREFPAAQIIVSDDGSIDQSAEIAQAANVEIVRRPYSGGNGAAIKAGARAANRDLLLFMDADGQHQPQDVPKLLSKLSEGYDMVVGARTPGGQANWHRGLANAIYNRLASWMVGYKIQDLTSGFRVANRKKFMEFLHLLPNGFSYPTTSTMAFFRAGYTVAYSPINVQKRTLGTTSHVRLWRDGVRFFLIIFKIGTLYSPLKIFIPASAFFLLSGIMYYGYTFFTQHRFTNMSVLLFSAAVIIFLIGLVSEQITSLMYGGGSSETPGASEGRR